MTIHRLLGGDCRATLRHAVKRSLARALYTLCVAVVAVVMVALLLGLTATSLSDDECRLWSGLAHCPPLAEIFGLESVAALTPPRPVQTALPPR